VCTHLNPNMYSASKVAGVTRASQKTSETSRAARNARLGCSVCSAVRAEVASKWARRNLTLSASQHSQTAYITTKQSKDRQMTPQDKYDAASSDAYDGFHDDLQADLNDVSVWVGDKHGLDDVFLHCEQHINRLATCDLSIINAPFIKSREQRVAVREAAKKVMQVMGYRFDLIHNYDLEYREPASRADDMSAHQRLRAIERIAEVVT
jgi:hypothetical protein